MAPLLDSAMNEEVNYCSQCGVKITPEAKFCSNCGHDLINSSTKTTLDKTIKVEVTNVTVEKGFKAIEKVVKAPGATLKKGVKATGRGVKATGKVVTETIKTLEYDFWIPVALLIGVVVFFVVFSGDINR